MEYDATGASPLRSRIYELRPPLGVPVNARHNSQNIHSRGPQIYSNVAYGSGEHDLIRASPLSRSISEVRPPLNVPVSGRHNFKIYILDGHTFTQNMRMDQGHTMLPEPALHHAAFLSYCLHYVYQLVEGITRKIYILEVHTSTQKMRMDQGNTMRPEPALYAAAFIRYALH